MVNRFTPKAQAALTAAKHSAEKMGHSYIGSEHLILGILSYESVGKKLLEDKKITYKDVYARLTEIAGLGNENNAYIRELTPKCKRVIELSAIFAKRYDSIAIGTEHLLLGICEDGESVGARLLANLGLNLQGLKGEICTLLEGTEKETKADKQQIPACPTLSLYGRSLNDLARQGKCDPLIGRELELTRLIQVLCRRTKNNPCLIGEPGVGKTAIVEGLAQRINEGNVPTDIKDKIIVSLDLPSMIAGAKYRGEFEERMKCVINEIKHNDSIILFIDEIHTIMGAGAAEGAIDAASILKPILARGQLRIIGATTFDEYRTHIEKDAALERRFQSIVVKEPTTDEAVQILSGLSQSYEAFHGIAIPKDVIEHAVKQSIRYITDRFLPDKAIDVIDEACSKLKTSVTVSDSQAAKLEAELLRLCKERETLILSGKLDKARALREREQEIKRKIEGLQRKSSQPRQRHLTREDVDGVITQWTTVPLHDLSSANLQSIANLEEALSCRVIGQRKATDTVAAAIKRGRAGLKNPSKPIGAFLFLGPTGVGKTELAKAVADTVFGSDSLVRLDMSEYMEKHSISRLIGSPPGYVGYEDGGILTRAVRKKPYSVVLFDEIEKAHQDIYNILLQILDEGALTDSHGRQVSFKNTIVILTSNVGATSIVKPTHLGFSATDSQTEENRIINEQVSSALKREFSPELLGRIDEVVIFNRLSKSDTEKIVASMLDELTRLCRDMGISIRFDSSVPAHIVSFGYSRENGARPLRRAITTVIENPLSNKILLGEIKKGDSVSVFAESGEIKFKCYNLI